MDFAVLYSEWWQAWCAWFLPLALMVVIWTNIVLAYATHGVLGFGALLSYIYGRKYICLWYTVLFVSYTVLYLGDVIADAYGVEYVKGYREPRLMVTRWVILWAYCYVLYRMVQRHRAGEDPPA